VGVPFDSTKRDIDTMTEELVMVDKEMQFVYGDDTTLINAMNRVAFRKMAKQLNLTTGSKTADEELWSEPLTQPKAQLQTSEGVSAGTGGVGEGGEVVNENRLNLFLQSAGQLFEDILNEESVLNEQKTNHLRGSSGPPKSFFVPSANWVSLGGDASEGANELVRGRTVSALCFSSLQPHLLLTAHPYNETDEADLRPYKVTLPFLFPASCPSLLALLLPLRPLPSPLSLCRGQGIYCIWSLSAPGAPAVVLEGSGQPSCCSFSSTQTNILTAGTSEGTIHLWDLRESNTLHANRDTIDLRIAKGLRKPCYSTQTLTISNSLEYAAYAATLRMTESSDVEWDQHSCPLVQIQAISPASSSSGASSSLSLEMSHFVSLDSSGKAIIWLASQTTSGGGAADGGVDYGLSPWGKMRLVRQRVLYGATSHPFDAYGTSSFPPLSLLSVHLIPLPLSLRCGRLWS
jgi:hypothetical protein